MDIEWGSKVAEKFVTNVGLITSSGPVGPNVMACEWTHMVSYSPGLLAVCINPNAATARNIRKSKEFGVSLCAAGQNVLSSVAGGCSGEDTEKMSALRELGFDFYDAKKIKAPMVKGAAANVECRLVKEMMIGDHVMFIGEAVASSASPEEPIAYHAGKYWKMKTEVGKPSDEERRKIKAVVRKFAKSQGRTSR